MGDVRRGRDRAGRASGGRADECEVGPLRDALRRPRVRRMERAPQGQRASRQAAEAHRLGEARQRRLVGDVVRLRGREHEQVRHLHASRGRSEGQVQADARMAEVRDGLPGSRRKGQEAPRLPRQVRRRQPEQLGRPQLAAQDAAVRRVRPPAMDGHGGRRGGGASVQPLGVLSRGRQHVLLRRGQAEARDIRRKLDRQGARARVQGEGGFRGRDHARHRGPPALDTRLRERRRDSPVRRARRVQGRDNCLGLPQAHRGEVALRRLPQAARADGGGEGGVSVRDQRARRRLRRIREVRAPRLHVGARLRVHVGMAPARARRPSRPRRTSG